MIVQYPDFEKVKTENAHWVGYKDGFNNKPYNAEDYLNKPDQLAKYSDGFFLGRLDRDGYKD